MEENVILVDPKDNEIGVMEKMKAHEKGELHRAFSVFIFNTKGEIMLQKRDSKKYHSGGLWSNTCCSHPRPGEPTKMAASRRLNEEMGLNTVLFSAFSFIYRSELDSNLIEHELDHVFVGYTNDLPTMNPEEVEDYKFMSLINLELDLLASPELYTTWLKICFKNLLSHLNSKN